MDTPRKMWEWDGRGRGVRWGFAPNPTKNLRFLDFPLPLRGIPRSYVRINGNFLLTKVVTASPLPFAKPRQKSDTLFPLRGMPRSHAKCKGNCFLSKVVTASPLPFAKPRQKSDTLFPLRGIPRSHAKCKGNCLLSKVVTALPFPLPRFAKSRQKSDTLDFPASRHAAKPCGG